MIYLFVLASEQGVLRPEKTMESPLPSSPSLSARTHALPCVLSRRLCYARQGRRGACNHWASENNTHRWPAARRGGRHDSDCQGNGAGLRNLCAGPSTRASKQGHRGAPLADVLRWDPRARRGKAPRLSGEPGWKQILTGSQRGEEGGGVWPDDAIRNDSNGFLAPSQKSLFSPAFCCWIAEDDLKPEPAIYQNETVSQIV